VPAVRELTPADAPALTAPYAEHDRWADRGVEAVREALAGTEIAVGIERSGPAVDLPSGGTEELVRMVYERE